MRLALLALQPFLATSTTYARILSVRLANLLFVAALLISFHLAVRHLLGLIFLVMSLKRSAVLMPPASGAVKNARK
jgi:hypothetical protein